MTYYNISNIENTINENSENFKLLNSIPKQWNYKGTFNGFQRKQATQHISGMPKNIRYSSMPILYQHREKFGKIWERFEPNSVITNRGCLNQLATMNIGSVKHCTFKLYKARDVTNGAILDQYILELGNSVDTENLGIYQQSFFTGACVAGMLIKDGKCSPEFNTYKLSNFKMNLKTRTSSCPAYLDSNIPYFVQPKNSIKVYYTSEIDAFIKDGYDNKVKHIPVEIKAKLDKNNNMDISPKTAFFTALQCQLAGCNDIVFGFHDGERIQNVKHFSLQDLKDIAAKNEKYNNNVDEAIQEAKFLLKEIINQFDERVQNGTMNIWDTLIIVKRLEIKEHRLEQRYCLDYYVKQMLEPTEGPKTNRYVIPQRRYTCEL